MDFSYGLLGIGNTVKENRKERQRKAKLPDSQKVIAEEMEAFCEKKAAEYGFMRGANLANLQASIANESYYYEEVSMKNEDAVVFLEKEREEIAARRDAMFDRIKQLPIGGVYELDKSSMEIGRRSRVMDAEGANDMLRQAEKYLENTGIDFPTEEYLQRIHYQAGLVLNGVEKDIAILQKGMAGEEYVNEQLRLYEGKYKILQNIVLESVDSQGNTSEVDAYIITDRGLVVAEVKNYGNENQRLHITNDGRWVMEDIHNGSILRRIDHSPVEQNTRHCLAVERLLRQKFGEECNIPVIPVIFIANNKVSINNESRSSVIRVSEFYTFINSVPNTAAVSRDMQ
ncbi:MAG: NERD domain-containing protein, partial [Ruminococcus flavefaciens]|nr:NERD domain-containing protein [Ruminococcus flavefaciens]